jgi:hypothetical protein
MPETTLAKTASVKLSAPDFQQLILMIDDMSRLHVSGIEELCRAASDGTPAVTAVMLKLVEQVQEARRREHRRYVAAKRLA